MTPVDAKSIMAAKLQATQVQKQKQKQTEAQEDSAQETVQENPTQTAQAVAQPIQQAIPQATQQKTDPAVQTSQATKQEKSVPPDTRRVFFGVMPQAVSLMTNQGIPVPFYMGYHITNDQDVIDFLNKEKNVEDVTAKVDISKVPVPPTRNRSRSWASASRSGIDPTVFSPADLIRRAVAGSDTLTNAAPSNS